MVKYFFSTLIALNFLFLSACLNKIITQKDICSATYSGITSHSQFLDGEAFHFKNTDDPNTNILISYESIDVEKSRFQPKDMVKIIGNFDTLAVHNDALFIQVRNARIRK